MVLATFNELDARKKMLVYSCVLLAQFLISLDTSIVGTIMPKVIADFKGLELYSWVFSVYMASMILALTIFGKLCDLYGRKGFYIAGASLFTLGSALCSIAPSMELLILFRGLQGIGGGILTALSPVIVGDLFPPSERGKYQGFLGAIFALGSILGPIAGGVIADLIHWRATFLINIPIGIICLIMIITSLPDIKPGTGMKKIDFVGITILALILLALYGIIGLFNGNNSLPVLLPLLLLAALVLLFVFIERKAKEPVFPIPFFKSSMIFTVCVATGFIIGASMYIVTIYVPLLFQGVMKDTAFQAGLNLIPLPIALVSANIVSGMMTTRTGKYRLITIAGFVCMTGGFLLLSFNSSYFVIMTAIALLGAGLGITFPILMLVIQNSMPYENLGAVTTANQFSRNIGGVIGIALLGLFMNFSLTADLSRQISNAGIDNINAQSLIHLKVSENNLDGLRAQVKALQEKVDTGLNGKVRFSVEDALQRTIQTIFLISAFFAALALFVTIIFLKEIPLRKKNETEVST